jgi:hypothetical protein
MFRQWRSASQSEGQHPLEETGKRFKQSVGISRNAIGFCHSSSSKHLSRVKGICGGVEMAEPDVGGIKKKRVFLSKGWGLWVPILIIAILICSSLTLSFVFNHEETDPYHYHITLNSNSTEEYSVACPVPVDISGNLCAHFIDDLQIEEGRAIIELNPAPYGPAITISGKGRIDISWNASLPISAENRFWYMSMTSGDFHFGLEKNLTWVYSDTANVSLSLSFSCEYRPGNPGKFSILCAGDSSTHRTYMIKEHWFEIGWNQIEIVLYQTSTLGC